MAYRADVEFLEDSNPKLIEQSSNEFKRLHALLERVEDDLEKGSRVDWESDGRDLYVKRLGEAKKISDALSTAFRAVYNALADYADAVDTAKQYYRNGKYAEEKLAALIGQEADAITPTARAAEPLRQWEDLRSTTGLLDWIAELPVDVDEIRDEAEYYYNQAKGHYGDAQRVESQARQRCVAEVTNAYQSLPEFRSDLSTPLDSLVYLHPLQAEARQASKDPLTQLPGTGIKVDEIPATGVTTGISDMLARIQARTAGLPEAQGNNYWLPSNDDEGRRQYITANKALINAAAHDSGLPPEMIAGIAWQEVEGDPGLLDDLAFDGRKFLPGDPDTTSLGPIAIQVRRAAEVLGYDPDTLTDTQRDTVVSAIKDPAKNIFIASEYIAQIKAESDFADVPPEKLTREQMQELAARYNGGPYYMDPNAQAYGRAFDSRLDQARAALQ